MSGMHLRQPGFSYSVCRPLTKNNKRIKQLKKKRFKIYLNELDKDCFQHDMTYGYFKDLNRTIFAGKVLCNKAFNIAKNL